MWSISVSVTGGSHSQGNRRDLWTKKRNEMKTRKKKRCKGGWLTGKVGVEDGKVGSQSDQWSVSCKYPADITRTTEDPTWNFIRAHNRGHC